MYELATWGKDNTLETPITLSGRYFSDFLELCLCNADMFSLNKAVWTNCVCEDFQKELEPFLEDKVKTTKWFGYDYSVAPPTDRREISVYLYRANMKVRDIILRYCSDVFLRTGKDGAFQDSNQTLEDLCFFSGKRLFVGTVSHEFLLSVDPLNKEFEEFMGRVGNWNYINQIPFSVVTATGT